VEEYLVSDRLAKSRASHFHIPFRTSHIKLAAASLIYLQWAKDFVKEDTGRPISSFSSIVSYDQFSGDLPGKVPLLAYACKFWYLHVRMCEGYLPEREIRLVKDFLKCQERISLFEIGTYGPSDDDADKGCHSSRHNLLTENRFTSLGRPRAELNFIASPLYHAARLGLVDVVTALLEETDRSHMSLQSLASSQPMHQRSTPGTFGDELRIACFYGQKEIVEILLNAGADVEAVGGAFKTAMGACMQSRTPNPGIIQILLESVETVHPDIDWIVGWVLRWAAMEGHLPVVSTLMSKVECMGPQTYIWTQDYFLLHRRVAPRNGRKDIEGSESYHKRGTAPYEAASAGHHEILSLLISNWSNIDEKDYEGRTSLYWAAFNGHTETVRLLLQHGARTYGHSQVREWTPAYWACMRGFDEIEKLLVHADRTSDLIVLP
jgi:ankyrin repeat protein